MVRPWFGVVMKKLTVKPTLIGASLFPGWCQEMRLSLVTDIEETTVGGFSLLPCSFSVVTRTNIFSGEMFGVINFSVIG